MSTPKRNEPERLEPSIANYQRAMRALVDKLIESNFNPKTFDTDHIYIEVTGGFYDEYYHHLDYPEHYEEYPLYLANPEYYEDKCYGDRASIDVEIGKEIVDVYRDMLDVFNDPTGTGEFDYHPIELIDDSNIRYSWAMRILANNLIEKNFDPFAFPPDASADFNVQVMHREDVLYLIANMRNC
jgi:hypothetical protein